MVITVPCVAAMLLTSGSVRPTIPQYQTLVYKVAISLSNCEETQVFFVCLFSFRLNCCLWIHITFSLICPLIPDKEAHKSW